MELAINFSGGTVSFPTSINVITLTGTGTLSANYTITSSGTISAGSHFTFYYKATVDKASYNFNILGTNLSTTQLNRESTIEAVYNGTSWDLNITPNTKSTGWLEPTDNVFANSDYFFMVVPVSFESGYQGNNSIYIPFESTIVDVQYCQVKTAAGTDGGTVTVWDTSFPVWQVAVPASTAIDTTIAGSELQAAEITANTFIKLVSAKSTAGGTGLVTIVFQRV